MEVIPRTLTQNCGANVIRTLTKLRAKHAEEPASSWGIDGEDGQVKDMRALGVWEPYQASNRGGRTDGVGVGGEGQAGAGN